MKYEKRLIIITEEGASEYTYYVVKTHSEEFVCDMYNVGIQSGNIVKEIDNFSPCFNEAERLCNYLYENHVSCDNLFSVSEEFITMR